MPESPDARLYVELARCHCYHSIHVCPLCAPTFLMIFYIVLFFGCICTKLISTSNAPKLF